jgi:hypothetical protein
LPTTFSISLFKVDDDHIRRELQIAFDQADRDQWRGFDVEAFIAEARRRLADSARGTMTE